MVVRVKNLTVRYPANECAVLQRFSLTAAAGELIYLSGPTGCGKSTLLNVLSGVSPHIVHADITGEIHVAGINPAQSPIAKTGKSVGHLFQNVESQLFTDRVEDEVALPIEFGAVSCKDPAGLVQSTLEDYGLNARRRENIRFLSSGYKQRLALASLHLPTKAVLLLDEPFSYLDDRAASDLQKTLLLLKEKGLTILIADHRDRLVLPIADHVVRMNDVSVDTPSIQESIVFSDPGPVVAETRNLGFSYSARVESLLSDLNIIMQKSGCVIVQGSNGCGKTTLCLLLAGVLKPSSGRVTVSGMDTFKLTPSKRSRCVGLVLQNPDRQLFSSRVDDGLSTPEGERVLDALGLIAFRHRHPRALSFGQKRRLALAGILSRSPTLMVVDEPSIGQDTKSLTAVLRLLVQYQREGGSLLVTTHDDRVTSLLKGRTVRL